MQDSGNEEADVRMCSVKKVFLIFSQNSQESTCARVAGLKACNFVQKETFAQVLFGEFSEIFKNTFFHRTPLVAASGNVLQCQRFNKRYFKINVIYYYVKT